jgi:uncharacterized membrane protein YozB (DUF420 family)
MKTLFKVYGKSILSNYLIILFMYSLLNILQVPLNVVYLLCKTTIFMHETMANNGSFRKKCNMK